MNNSRKSSYLLHLLQLTSPSLPVGAYSYSEGLETLIEQEIIQNPQQLQQWLSNELSFGAIRLESAVCIRAFHAAQNKDWEKVHYWNHWLSATRETEELRLQSWQMGESLLRLLRKLQPELPSELFDRASSYNFAIAFGVAAANWQVDPNSVVLGFLHSWTSNLVTAAVKLIPLGQTQGQQVLWKLYPVIEAASSESRDLADEELGSCSWGQAIASMQHETQYSRLFRS